jgi:hypothetical protein
VDLDASNGWRRNAPEWAPGEWGISVHFVGRSRCLSDLQASLVEELIMVLDSTPLGNANDASALDRENDASGSVLAAGDSVVEESPPIVRHFTLESQKEVTIRQVAPLVLILTGATFLNVGDPPINKVSADNRYRPFRFNQLSSFSPPSAVISISQKLDSNGLSQRML